LQFAPRCPGEKSMLNRMVEDACASGGRASGQRPLDDRHTIKLLAAHRERLVVKKRFMCHDAVLNRFVHDCWKML
jgi:hypothetical protein